VLTASNITAVSIRDPSVFFIILNSRIRQCVVCADLKCYFQRFFVLCLTVLPLPVALYLTLSSITSIRAFYPAIIAFLSICIVSSSTLLLVIFSHISFLFFVQRFMPSHIFLTFSSRCRRVDCVASRSVRFTPG
jgi:hypothetical protein